MANTDLMITTLKRVLKSRGKTYSDLAQALHLSEASIKRLFSDKSFTLHRLDEICQWLELDFFELARIARGESMATAEMTLKQEQVLADDLQLLGLFYLVRNNWQLHDIVQDYEISEPACIRLLIRLDRAGLIELLPDNRIRLRVSRQVKHQPYGPIRLKHGEMMTNNFLAVRFDEHQGYFEFVGGDLSPASALIIQRKLDQVAAEFQELSELDINLPTHERTLYGAVFGIRPWNSAEEMCGFKKRHAEKPSNTKTHHESTLRASNDID
jgi:DNA-binding Xre family transcriptional regulator